MPKTLFIDSTPDIDRLWKRVHKPTDIPIACCVGVPGPRLPMASPPTPAACGY